MERIIRGIIVGCCYIVGGIVIFLLGWILRGVKAKRRKKKREVTVDDPKEVQTIA